MPDIQFVFTPGDNKKHFSTLISGTYQLVNLVIEASSINGLIKAIRSIRIYFLFNFGAPGNNVTATYHLSKYIWVTDSLINEINFKEEFLVIDPKWNCTGASVTILEDVKSPVTRMTLTLNQS